MAESKLLIYIHRIIGLLGCIANCLYTVWIFHTMDRLWAYAFVFLTVFVIYMYVRYFNRSDKVYGANYGMIIFLLFLFWRAYSKYKREQPMEKYAFVYNAERRRLGIPEIPKDWYIQHSGKKYEDWRPKTEEATGHESKMIDCDSLYNIESERDDYNFKSVHDSTRSISIEFKYARGKSKDSIFYTYNLKDTSIRISRQQADSIFEAAKIKKDY